MVVFMHSGFLKGFSEVSLRPSRGYLFPLFPWNKLACFPAPQNQIFVFLCSLFLKTDKAFSSSVVRAGDSSFPPPVLRMLLALRDPFPFEALAKSDHFFLMPACVRTAVDTALAIDVMSFQGSTLVLMERLSLNLSKRIFFF